MNKLGSKYWTAFYTKPRNEKKVADRLSEQGLHIYCPTRTVIKQWSDRRKKVKEPVFTSYIFAEVDELERQEVLRDQGIVSSVFWLSKPVIIRDNEIQAIRAFLEDYPEAKAENLELKEGQRLEISEGPLKGEKGELIKRKGSKVILNILSLNYSLQAEISALKVQEV
ncbi:UpxY family transcription antiterminator [Roseivirga sp.]|uniref:UpxY family transcription antiterminator n=1 Tax=Roseivirga sp. TaxID=1964215 RepID=UPI003B51A8E8